MISRVLIRSEGDVNGFFTLTYKDGTVRKYWSCDQGSLEQEDDGPYDLGRDEELKLFDLWFKMDCEDESLCHYAEFVWESGEMTKAWQADE